MAHEIRSNDSLVLARTAAWHGLGQIQLPQRVADGGCVHGRAEWDALAEGAGGLYGDRHGRAYRGGYASSLRPSPAVCPPSTTSV